MSFIYPSNYKIISENLADAYAKVRDALNDGVNAADAYSDVISAQNTMLSQTEDEVLVSETTDPRGSIASDLGAPWLGQIISNLNAANSKKIAAERFATMQKELNNHVVRRTGVTNLSNYFQTYAYNSEWDVKYNLFEENGANSSYFTADFVEFSNQIGVTIPELYQQ